MIIYLPCSGGSGGGILLAAAGMADEVQLSRRGRIIISHNGVVGGS